MRRTLQSIALALGLVATTAMPGVVFANDVPKAKAGACSDLFNHERHEHCWLGNADLAAMSHTAPAVEGHRHLRF